jgi:hypothetical protein
MRGKGKGEGARVQRQDSTSGKGKLHRDAKMVPAGRIDAVRGKFLNRRWRRLTQIRNLSLQIFGLRFEALAILGVGFIQIESV